MLMFMSSSSCAQQQSHSTVPELNWNERSVQASAPFRAGPRCAPPKNYWPSGDWAHRYTRTEGKLKQVECGQMPQRLVRVASNSFHKQQSSLIGLSLLSCHSRRITDDILYKPETRNVTTSDHQHGIEHFSRAIWGRRDRDAYPSSVRIHVLVLQFIFHTYFIRHGLFKWIFKSWVTMNCIRHKL